MTRALTAPVLVAAVLGLLPAVAAGATVEATGDELTAQDAKARAAKGRDEKDDSVKAAQDPGGQQYTDPLENENQGGPTTTTPAPPPTSPAATAGTPSTTTNGASTEAAADGKGGSEPGIPRTGFPALVLIGAGSLAIGAGMALRAATRPGA